MFEKSNVKEILNILRDKIGFFANEAHFQMSFIVKAMSLYKDKFILIPEYPINSLLEKDKLDNIDLLIIDSETKEKTFIEFKHKTTNTSKKSLSVEVKDAGVVITPTKMDAQDLGRFDCWSDIERLESYKLDKNSTISNAFFILISNDSKYWEEDGDGKFGNAFAMNSDHFDADLDGKRWKSWDDARPKKKHPDELGSVDYCDLGAISEGRNRVIRIKKPYDFDWDVFIEVKNYKEKLAPRERKQCGLYKRLIVEI